VRFDEIPHNVIEQARAGNFRAMETLCEMIQPGAYAVLLSMLRDGDDAADALQEVLIRVIRFLPSLRETSLLPAWLMRTLTNQANTTRKATPANVIDVSEMAETDVGNRLTTTTAAPPSPRTAAAALEISALINQAIVELPPRQKTALILFEMEQLSIKEVGAIMELTDGAVKFHLHEARKNLRKRLAELGVSAEELSGEEQA
jgi:RNA polymerase sigma-70 factor (ECF subfamily)